MNLAGCLFEPIWHRRRDIALTDATVQELSFAKTLESLIVLARDRGLEPDKNESEEFRGLVVATFESARSQFRPHFQMLNKLPLLSNGGTLMILSFRVESFLGESWLRCHE